MNLAAKVHFIFIMASCFRKNFLLKILQSYNSHFYLSAKARIISPASIPLYQQFVVVLSGLIRIVHQDHRISQRLLYPIHPDIHCAPRQVIARRRASHLPVHLRTPIPTTDNNRLFGIFFPSWVRRGARMGGVVWRRRRGNLGVVSWVSSVISVIKDFKRAYLIHNIIYKYIYILYYE